MTAAKRCVPFKISRCIDFYLTAFFQRRQFVQFVTLSTIRAKDGARDADLSLPKSLLVGDYWTSASQRTCHPQTLRPQA